MVSLNHAYKIVKKKMLQFEFDGFSFTTIFGFIPFPAPQFKRKRLRTRGKSKRSFAKQNPQPRKDPVVDTMENLRKDAIDDGDYVTAFGSAIAQNIYEKNKNDSYQTTF